MKEVEESRCIEVLPRTSCLLNFLILPSLILHDNFLFLITLYHSRIETLFFGFSGSSISRHEQELGLSVKPNSEHTRLLQFALSCQSSGSNKDTRPLNHPINNLKDIEQQLFGHLTKKDQQKRKSKKYQSGSASKFKCKQSTATKLLSYGVRPLWDLKDTPSAKGLSKAATKPSQVYSCKPETLYTIKEKKIVPVSQVSSLPVSVRSASHSSSGSNGQPFVVSDIEDSEIETLCREDIQRNKLSIEEIKLLPKFQNYDKGSASQVTFENCYSYIKCNRNGVEMKLLCEEVCNFFILCLFDLFIYLLA
jgi:hypothetical protein